MEIEGYEDYLIYEDGRIWSKYGKGRFMKPLPDSNGYLHVRLYKDGKSKTMTIHRLIGNAYIPNPENKPEIDHIDNIRQNNDISNLRWVTKSENKRNRAGWGDIPFRGVCKDRNRFKTQIRIDGKLKHIGIYGTPEEAGEAYIQYCTDNNINIY